MQRGQVTLFVILGIVVALGVISFILFRNAQTETQIQTDIPGVAQFAGQQELRQFMDTCMRDAVYNGVEILRLQGGYITLPEGALTLRIKDGLGRQIVEQRGLKEVTINPSGPGNERVYWLDSNNKVAIPTIPSVQNELSNYVKSSVLRCVGDFNSFKTQGYAVETETINVKTDLSKEITVTMQYPITFTKQGQVFKESEFIFRLPINLRKLLLMGSELTLQEYYQAFLEYDTKGLIGIYAFYGGPSAESLPPLSFTDVGSSCNPVTWSMAQTEMQLKDVFTGSIPRITISGYGENVPETINPYALGVYKSLTHSLLPQRESSEINFLFKPDLDFYFDIYPRDQNSIRPDIYSARGIRFLPLFCMTQYRFKYTLKFPVLANLTALESRDIDIVSKTLKQGVPFSMQIPLGVMLCGNQERKCTGPPGYLKKYEAAIAALQQANPDLAGFCEDKNRKSKEMTIKTVDRDTGLPVPATILFGCATDECYVGSTAQGDIKATLPYCVNGRFSAVSEGFVEARKSETIVTDTPAHEIKIPLERKRTLDVEFRLIGAQKVLQKKICGETDFETLFNAPKEGVSILAVADDGPLPAIVDYPTGTGRLPTIELTSGTYTFSFLVRAPINVEPGEIGGEWTSLNETGDTYSSGEWIYGQSSMKATFGYEELKRARKLILFVPVNKEQTTMNIAGFLDMNIVQPNGAFVAEDVYFDDDCNPQTEAKETSVSMGKNEVLTLLKPRLE